MEEQTIIDTNNNAIKYSINSVMWEPYFILSKASLGQIMYTLYHIKNNINNLEIQNLLSTLVTKFENILISDNQLEKNVLYFNLIVNLPYSININNHLHNRIRLSKARIGILIKCLKQRVQFIIDREIPVPKYMDPTYLPEFPEKFTKLQNIMKGFLVDIVEFEQQFVALFTKPVDLNNETWD